MELEGRKSGNILILLKKKPSHICFSQDRGPAKYNPLCRCVGLLLPVHNLNPQKEEEEFEKEREGKKGTDAPRGSRNSSSCPYSNQTRVE